MIAHGDESLGDRLRSFFIFVLLQIVELKSIELGLETEHVVHERAVVKVDGRLTTTAHIQHGDPAQVTLTPQSEIDKSIRYRQHRVDGPVEFVVGDVLRFPGQVQFQRLVIRFQFDRVRRDGIVDGCTALIAINGPSLMIRCRRIVAYSPRRPVRHHRRFLLL